MPVCSSNSRCISRKYIPGLSITSSKIINLSTSVNVLVPELGGYRFGVTSLLDSYKATILETVDLSTFRLSATSW